MAITTFPIATSPVSSDMASFLQAANDAAARTALGLGELATQNGTFSGTSSGTNTGDQTNIPGNAATATALQNSEAVNKAFVSLQGNDGTAVIGNRSLPFSTVLAAYNAINALTPPTGLIVFTDAFQDPPAPYNFFSFDWTGDWSSGIGMVSDGYAHDPASINMRLVGPARQSIWIFATNCFVNISTDAFDTDNFIGADVILENVGGARWRLDLSEDVATTASTVLINGGDLTDLVFSPNSGPSPITVLKNLESMLSLNYNLPSGNIGAVSLYNCRLEDTGSISLQTSSGTFADFFMAGGGTKSDDGGGSNIFLQRSGAALTARFVGVNFAGKTSSVIVNNVCVGGSVSFENCTGVRIQDSGTSNAFSLRGCPNPLVDALGSGSTVTSGLSYQSVAAGTAYTLTGSFASLDFGTTDPAITLAQPGTYLIAASVQTDYVGATYAALGQSVSYKLRRTNNTAADLSGAGPFGNDLPVITGLTAGGPSVGISGVIYTTPRSNDVIVIQGMVTATPSAGSVVSSSATLVAVKLS